MKSKFTILYLAAFALISLNSCSDTDEPAPVPYLSQVQNTECLSSGSRASEVEAHVSTTFEMRISSRTAECLFRSLSYPCDFGMVNVDLFFKDGVMTIVEYPSSDLANCLCKVDASFKINDLPKGSFILKIYRGNSKGEYNKDYPMLTEVIEVKKGTYIFPYK